MDELAKNRKILMEKQENKKVIDSFKEFLESKGVNLSDDNFFHVTTIGIVVFYPNIVDVLCPDLTKDKENLCDFSLLTTNYEKRQWGSGLLYADNFILMAHPYFRRGFHANNNFAPNFIDMFWNYQDVDNKAYIAIDHNRVRINVDNGMYLEEDTWYGPRFCEQISAQCDGIVVLRPPADIDEHINKFLFSDTYSLNIKWKTKNNIRTFQSEEFKTEKIKIDRDGKGVFPARYLHAEFDLGTNSFRHFDGALHFYNNEEYYLRRDSDFNYNNKNNLQIKTDSQKLFKINGNISIETWREFTSHFMSGNPLIIEYFEGKLPDYIPEKYRSYTKKVCTPQSAE
jgi:hypothetical protein